ncbi:MAG: acyl-CoA thioesterase [Candidatus Sericytochromatia bacterium]
MTEKSKKVSESVVYMSRLMNPTEANLFGNVHGGNILKLADEIAYVCGCKHAGFQCVTASVDRVDFYHSINIGDLVTFQASVNLVGRSSMEIGVKVVAENLLTQNKVHTNSCYFTMVALDSNGKPTEVPKLTLETEDDTRRNHEAQVRRQQRLDHRFQKNKQEK